MIANCSCGTRSYTYYDNDTSFSYYSTVSGNCTTGTLYFQNVNYGRVISFDYVDTDKERIENIFRNFGFTPVRLDFPPSFVLEKEFPKPIYYNKKPKASLLLNMNKRIFKIPEYIPKIKFNNKYGWRKRRF
jgi:hypothetical protein